MKIVYLNFRFFSSGFVISSCLWLIYLRRILYLEKTFQKLFWKIYCASLVIKQDNQQEECQGSKPITTIICKTFWEKLRKLDDTEKLWYMFLHIFWALVPKVYFCGKTACNFKILLIFPHFLRPIVLRRSIFIVVNETCTKTSQNSKLLYQRIVALSCSGTNNNSMVVPTIVYNDGYNILELYQVVLWVS